jgi:hypothetical protein
MAEQNRRDVLKLLGASGVGVVFSTALPGCAEQISLSAKASSAAEPAPKTSTYKPFFFLQLSDTHWGFKGPPNPESDMTLKKTIELINSSSRQPDFIVFTGDLTHTTDDVNVRRQRLTEFKQMASELKVKNLKFMPGEHDASLDEGAVYKEVFGDVTYSWDHEGVHFIALDNVTDLGAGMGDKQLAWLEADLAKLPPDAPVVVFSHRPLFDCIAKWEWWTKDGDKAIAILQKRKNVSCFYGHIHQDHFHMTGNIPHRASRSLVFPLPQPSAVGKRSPLPWNPTATDHGIGFRQHVVGGGEPSQARTIDVTDYTTLGARVSPTNTESPIAPRDVAPPAPPAAPAAGSESAPPGGAPPAGAAPATPAPVAPADKKPPAKGGTKDTKDGAKGGAKK